MNSENILAYLAAVSNKNLGLNFLMHLVILAAVFALFTIKNKKTKKLLVNGSLLILFLSVVTNALVYGNPVHFSAFLILSGFTVFELIKGKNGFDVPPLNINTFVSIIFICVGFWYPEFVSVNKLQSLLFSPIGIVPCPTLLTAFGLINLSYPQVNKPQYLAIVTMSLIFGVIGVFSFKVYLDIVLLVALVYGLINTYRFRKAALL